MRQMTRVILAHELVEQGISMTRIVEKLQVSTRTVIRWAQAIEQHGDLETYLENYQQAVLLYCDRHRVDDLTKKIEQAFIERFNRSLRKECLGWAKYKPAQILQLTLQVEDWLRCYYERPHISLNMRLPLKTQV